MDFGVVRTSVNLIDQHLSSEPSNAYWFAKIGVDTAVNEPTKVVQKMEPRRAVCTGQPSCATMGMRLTMQKGRRTCAPFRLTRSCLAGFRKLDHCC